MAESKNPTNSSFRKITDLSHKGYTENTLYDENIRESSGEMRLEQFEEAQRLIRDESIPNNGKTRYSKNGMTTLTYLIFNDFSFLVRSFVNRNDGSTPDLTARDHKYGAAPLDWAAYTGNYISTQILLKHMQRNSILLDQQASNVSCKTALMQAAQNGHLDIVKLLVDAGASLTIKDPNENTALNFANNAGHDKVRDFLQEYQALPVENDPSIKDDKLLTPRQSFLRFGKIRPLGTSVQLLTWQEEQEVLYQRRIRIEGSAQELIAAIKDNNHGVLKEIFAMTQKAQTAINDKKTTFGSGERILQKAQTTIDNRDALFITKQSEAAQIIKDAKKTLADQDKVRRDKKGDAERILERAANIVKDEAKIHRDKKAEAEAILFQARNTLENSAKILEEGKKTGNDITKNAQETLKEMKEIVNYVNNKGRTPWHYAALNGNIEAMTLLIQHDADINFQTQDRAQNTVLHLLINGQQTEEIETLLSPPIQAQLRDKGISLELDKKNAAGETPLIRAVLEGNLEAVKLLLAAGADCDIQNKPRKTGMTGETAFEIANRQAKEIAASIQTNLSFWDISKIKSETEKQKNFEDISKCLMHFQSEQLKHGKQQLETLSKAAEKIQTGESKLEPARQLTLLTKKIQEFKENPIPPSFINEIVVARSKKLIALLNTTSKRYGYDRQKNIRQAKKLIAQGIDLSVQEASGKNILSYLISNGYLSLIRQALQTSPENISAINDTTWKTTALHTAASKGDPSIMRELLETAKRTGNLALLNSQDQHNQTPLMIAIDEGQIDIAYLLISYGADFENLRNNKGHSSRDLAQTHKVLLQFMDRLKTTGSSSSSSAADAKEIQLTDEQRAWTFGLCVEAQDIPANDQPLLQGEQNQVRHEFFILRRNQRRSQELASALRDGEAEKVTNLLKSWKPAPAEFNADYQDSNGLSLLHLAAIAGHDEMVMLLLENKVDINQTDKEGNTALHFAVRHDRAVVIKTLLKAKADFNLENGAQQTPYALAKHLGHTYAEHLLPKPPEGPSLFSRFISSFSSSSKASETTEAKREPIVAKPVAVTSGGSSYSPALTPNLAAANKDSGSISTAPKSTPRPSGENVKN